MNIPPAVLSAIIDASPEQVENPSTLPSEAAHLIENMDEDTRDELRECKLRDAALEIKASEILSTPKDNDTESPDETFRSIEEVKC